MSKKESIKVVSKKDHENRKRKLSCISRVWLPLLGKGQGEAKHEAIFNYIFSSSIREDLKMRLSKKNNF
jgi:hypothetical protein